MPEWPINNEVLVDLTRSVNAGEPLSLDDQGWLVRAANMLSNALEEAREPTFARRLEEMLWPERFKPGDERHDSEHVYWQQFGDWHTRDSLTTMDDEQLAEAVLSRGEPDGFEWPDDPDELTHTQRETLIDWLLKEQNAEVDEGEPFQWSADTIEWVADAITKELR